MAVVIGAKPHFWAQASLVVPGDLGEKITADFKVKFKRLKTSEHRTVHDELQGGQLKDRELIDRVLLDWDGFFDEQGTPVPFTSDELADAAENWLGLEAAIVKSYFASAYIAPEKN